VREWYTLEDAEQALAQGEGACGPNSLAGVLEAFAAARPASREPARMHFYGPWEVNTGYAADVILDGSDDPPVASDPDGREQPFSQYVLDLAWWKVTVDEVPSILVRGPNQGDLAAAFGPPHLDFFVQEFEELPRDVALSFTLGYDPERPPSEWRVFAFFRPGWRVEVDVQGDPADGVRPAQYVLHADTVEQLFDLYAFAWPCHGAPVHLWTAKPMPAAAMKARFLARFPSVEVCP
jgi:hypothetical protein